MASKGEKTRADIVACAARLFYELGYERTSFSDIVAGAGVLRGNIYHYFKSKDDILKAVIEQHLDDFRALLAHWQTLHPTPQARLVEFVNMVVTREQTLTQFGCPIGSLNTELGKDRLDLQESARALFDLFRDWLAAQFQAMGHGEEAEALALHLLGRAQGIAVIAHVYRDAKLLQRETAHLEAWIGEFELRNLGLRHHP